MLALFVQHPPSHSSLGSRPQTRVVACSLLLFLRHPPAPSLLGSRSHTYVVAHACFPVLTHVPAPAVTCYLSRPQLQLIDDLMEKGRTPQDIINDIQNLDSELKRSGMGSPLITLSTVHRAKVRAEGESAVAAHSHGWLHPTPYLDSTFGSHVVWCSDSFAWS